MRAIRLLGTASLFSLMFFSGEPTYSTSGDSVLLKSQIFEVAAKKKKLTPKQKKRRAAARKKRASEEAEKAALNQRIAEAERKGNEAAQKVALVERIAQSAQQKVTSMEGALESLQREVQDVKSNKLALQKDMDDLRQKLAEEIKNFDRNTLNQVPIEKRPVDLPPLPPQLPGSLKDEIKNFDRSTLRPVNPPRLPGSLQDEIKNFDRSKLKSPDEALETTELRPLFDDINEGYRGDAGEEVKVVNMAMDYLQGKYAGDFNFLVSQGKLGELKQAGADQYNKMVTLNKDKGLKINVQDAVNKHVERIVKSMLGEMVPPAPPMAGTASTASSTSLQDEIKNFDRSKLKSPDEAVETTELRPLFDDINEGYRGDAGEEVKVVNMAMDYLQGKYAGDFNFLVSQGKLGELKQAGADQYNKMVTLNKDKGLKIDVQDAVNKHVERIVKSMLSEMAPPAPPMADNGIVPPSPGPIKGLQEALQEKIKEMQAKREAQNTSEEISVEPKESLVQQRARELEEKIKFPQTGDSRVQALKDERQKEIDDVINKGTVEKLREELAGKIPMGRPQ